MEYIKPPLTFEQQADLLLKRGMIGDRATMVQRLSVGNYYRLSGYWHTYRNPDDTFKPNTRFDKIWERYVFDRQLRLLVMDAIERVEVASRTQLAYHLAHATGNPFAYATDPAALPGLNNEDRTRFLEELLEDARRSREKFAEHFRTKYASHHTYMPIWMAAELMTLGELLTLYRGSHPQVKRTVSAVFGVHDVVFLSWLLALNTVRNMCAHHGRLWNREFGVRPRIPERDPNWHTPVEVRNDRVFAILTICKHCLNLIAPQSRWPERWRALLRDYPYIPKGPMGVPDDWEACPIWQSPEAHAAQAMGKPAAINKPAAS